MTNNQINYQRLQQDRQQMLINERLETARQAETKRYNVVQEQLRRIDQELQRDLQTINAKWKAKEIELQEHDMAFQHKLALMRKEQDDRRILNDSLRVQAQFQSNAIQSQQVQEQIRSNLVREEQNLLTYKSNAAVNDSIVQMNLGRASLQDAQTALYQAQTQTEATRPQNVNSQTFSNYMSPIINLFGTAVRAFAH